MSKPLNHQTTSKSQRILRQVDRLFAATARGPVCFRRGPAGELAWSLSGVERSILYRLIVECGFTADELGTLTPESFDLTGYPRTVQLGPAVAPARRGLRFPLRPATASILHELLLDRASGIPVFGPLREEDVLTLLAHDAEASAMTAVSTVDILQEAFIVSLGSAQTRWGDGAMELRTRRGGPTRGSTT